MWVAGSAGEPRRAKGRDCCLERSRSRSPARCGPSAVTILGQGAPIIIVSIVWTDPFLISASGGIANYNSGYTFDGYESLQCQNHISSGYYFSAREMLELSRDGFTALAYKLLMDTNFPSWLYPIICGSTTCWESPDTYIGGRNYPSQNDRGTFPTTLNSSLATWLPMTSFNCLAFGAVAEWIWKVVGGINPDDANPGFKNVIIVPQPGGGLTNSFTAYNCIRGPVVCTWTNANSTYTLTVSAPANTTATVYLPTTNNLAGIVESGVPAFRAIGVQSYYFTNWPQWANGSTVFQVGSGTYSFTITNVTF